MKRISVVIVLLFVLVSCNRAKRNELSALINSEVKYPRHLLAIKDSLHYPIVEFSVPIKLVIYYGPASCTSCKVAHLADYEQIFELSRNSHAQFRVIPIFAPAAADEEELSALVSACKIPDTIYVDTKGEFNRLNPSLSQSNYNFFLVDKNNRVVLVGDPLRGESMLDLFKSTLHNMLSHNGEYIPQ